MPKKLDPKHELMVLMTIKELKESSMLEIQTHIKETFKVDVEEEQMVRYLRRWRKGKITSANMVGDLWVYSLRDIPWWPEAQMIHVVENVTDAQATEWLALYKDEIKERSFNAGERMPNIREYESFVVVMETVDEIAGGLLPEGKEANKDDKQLLFPRLKGVPVIPRGWIKGWFRDNARLINQVGTISKYIAVSPARFPDGAKLYKKTVIGKFGPQTHEVIGPGTRFKYQLSFPMKGTRIESLVALKRFFKIVEITPVKGMGAYERAFGGTVKLASIEPTDLMS